MEALIRPELGLTFWTIACFILLVVLLSKTAWKPLLHAVEERERGIKHDRQTAETARAEAEQLKADLAAQLAQLKAEVHSRLDEARVTAEKEKDLLIEEARRAAAAIVETAKKEIDVQRAEASRELKDKVAELSLLAAERILLKQIDHKANTELASRYLAELEKERPGLNLGNN
ncbi:MAG: F0F1 ATP synthase subunit B [Elusimicrobiales bacterium]|nr:F0F1 ATP synthase subunit B [Elusimicrobiales bacterium]